MNNYVTTSLRILISVLFILSAISKTLPFPQAMNYFIRNLHDLGFVNACTKEYLPRLIIAFELAIGIAILQAHYLKRIVIPATILLLVAFCIHLGIQLFQGGAENCGCFGQLIPMTPLEALIKNILTIGILVYLFFKVSDKPPGENRFSILLLIFFVSAFLMFFLFPFNPPPCITGKQKPATQFPMAPSDSNLMYTMPIDTTTNPAGQVDVVDTGSKQTIKKGKDSAVTVKQPPTVAVPTMQEPPVVLSKYTKYNQFGGKTVNLNQGKKILCLFVPGCDHCRDAARQLVAASKTQKLPPGYVLFMNEETFKIPEFYKETGITYPYFLIEDLLEFYNVLGSGAGTPGIVYLWNGNVL
ncbi:MAG: MauE/DoxX family redox-associated membrane protein, partial [Ferruginibacter sp.]